ncbi:MAG: amino acid racemase [Parcubacteria group bacterium]|jgi:aspartate racemase
MKSKEDFTLGILGGMGPLAGIELQRKIVENTPALGDSDHIKMVCFTNPQIKDRTKSLNEGSDFADEIIKSFNSMKSLDVNIGLIACNTAHAQFEKISANVDFPLINIINETVAYLEMKYRGLKKIGLLATDGTIKSKIYEKALKQRGFSIIVPKNSDQQKLMDIIYGFDGIKASGMSAKNTREIKTIMTNLNKKGAEAIILGCTELSVLGIKGKKIVDPLDVVSRKIVNLVLR